MERPSHILSCSPLYLSAVSAYNLRVDSRQRRSLKREVERHLKSKYGINRSQDRLAPNFKLQPSIARLTPWLLGHLRSLWQSGLFGWRPKSARRRGISILGSAITVILGMFAVYANFWPFMRVSFDYFRNPADPFSVAFFTEYDGWLPVRKVASYCVSTYAIDPGIDFDHNMMSAVVPVGEKDTAYSNAVDWLSHDGRLSITCEDPNIYFGLGRPGSKEYPIGSRVEVLITYEYLLFRRQQKKRFVLDVDSTGGYHWQNAG